ncbi:putative lipoprotein [Vibrio cholerae HC-43B1]|nr:putative lipoprotein [Vibrio cholerae HC-43B1]
MKWFLAFWLVLTSCFSVSLYANDAVLQQAYQSQQSDLQVQGFGQVAKVLPDDNDGSRHQKFILKLNSGQTLLVAHNIDLAPRIPNLKVGDSVEFYGEYEWNKRVGSSLDS